MSKNITRAVFRACDSRKRSLLAGDFRTSERYPIHERLIAQSRPSEDSIKG